jgi:uncharacterized membrane protein YesL
LILILIPYNVWVLSLGSGFWNGILFWSNIVVGLLYLAMRAYIYIEIVTFDLSIYKILKNALIFAIVGFKRNVCAMIGKVLLVFLTLAFAYSGILLSLAIILPFLLLLANGAYMSVYAAYFKIEELMIKPYLETRAKQAEASEA